MYGEALKGLVGHEPRELWVGPEEAEMRLVCADGTLVMDTDGDCCSESWWADAIGVKQLLAGSRVTAAEEIDMPTPEDNRTRQEQDQAYGLKITTDRGVCTLVFRNSSNGYYGGWGSYRWDEPGGVPEGYRQITEDWSA